MARVLLVDDDVDLVEMNRLVLAHRGHDVACAYSAAEARSLLADVHPDLVVLDVMMESDTAGFELAREIHDRTPDLPVLMLSAIRSGVTTPPGFTPEEMRLPIVKFMDKPSSPERLADEIDAILAKR
jgi:two-component system OmpR family response regulator